MMWHLLLLLRLGLLPTCNLGGLSWRRLGRCLLLSTKESLHHINDLQDFGSFDGCVDPLVPQVTLDLLIHS